MLPLRAFSLAALLAAAVPFAVTAAPANSPASGPIHFADITQKAGIHFTHNNGAFGKKFLPETLGPGVAFIDYDNDGWQATSPRPSSTTTTTMALLPTSPKKPASPSRCTAWESPSATTTTTATTTYL